MKTKYALVLSGGGFNGAFQVGALKYIQDNWKTITGLNTPMKFDIISGISAGAINGALVAMGELDLLHKLWIEQIAKQGASEIYTSEFLDTETKKDKLQFKLDLRKLAGRLNVKVDLNIGTFKKLGMLFSKCKRKEVIDEILASVSEAVKANIRNFRSIADNTPLLEKLKVYLDRSKIIDTKFTCGFVSLNSGAYHSVAHDEFATDADFVNGVFASSSIPVIWNPVDKISYYRRNEVIVSHNNVDGGIMNVSPLGDVIKLINEDTDECRYRIFIINCNCGVPQYEAFSNKSIGAIAARSIYDLTLTEIFNNDVNHFLQINDLVKQVQWLEKGLIGPDGRRMKAFDAAVISPEITYDLGSPLVANEKLIYQRMAHGFQQAGKVLF